jgi:hypothetical protein
MWGFAWMFWVVPLFLFVMMMRRRRWERWAMMRGGYDRPGQGHESALRREMEGQQSTIDSLETRIAQLEERLDFTERLLAGRKEG